MSQSINVLVNYAQEGDLENCAEIEVDLSGSALEFLPAKVYDLQRKGINEIAVRGINYTGNESTEQIVIGMCKFFKNHSGKKIEYHRYRP